MVQFSHPDRLKERQMTFQLLLSKEEQTSLAKHKHPDNLHNASAPQYIRGDDAPTNAYYNHNNIKYLLTINEKNSTPEAVYISLHSKKKGSPGNLLIPRKRSTDLYLSLSPWLTKPSEGASGHPVRMPSCSRSSGRGEDDNFEWRLAIERRQLASERQLKALLQETERLREENAVLRIQASTSGPPRRQRSRGQVANSRPQQEPESIYPGTTGAIPGACNVRPHEPRTPMPRAPREESSDSTHFSAKDNVIKNPVVKFMRARLGPQEPGRSRPPMATTWAPRPDPMATPCGTTNWEKHPKRPPIGSISKRLDDMLSTPFCSHIINYEPPRGFLVPKFSTYDGTNDPFDHIMHYRQLMTLDIGNDALLCKVFPASLQGQALSWFHRLPPNSVGNFRDLSEAFVGQYLCSARHKQNISTLQNIKMQDNESLREFVKRFGQAVLQVEACSMDAVLQIFKRSICPGTPFFESLAKKPPTTMDDLFRRANKYSMLEDDVRAATSKFWACPTSSGLDPLERTHPQGIVVGDVPSTRIMAIQQRHAELSSIWSRRLIKAGHLKQYLRSDNGGRDAPNITTPGPRAPAAPKAVINYINGGPSDEEYDSRRKRQKLLRPHQYANASIPSGLG
ncbi:hypothetical protein CK203_088509 [Vitis vinifera]|uniref:Retrotransposon gag domain-containing protein n=1 Tax=Vitis vinifera TaxID=29760 RepID=A0A438EZY2_VITVI|nr:hypothetical protein CK203_088509 [Vitis vinifera]